MASKLKSELVARNLALSKFFCLISMIFPFLSIIGWTLEIPILTQGHPSLPAMQPNATFGLILSAVAAILFLKKENGPSKRNVAALSMATVVFLLGLLTLFEYIFGWNIGIDRIFINTIATTDQPFPGRPSPQAAFNFMLLGLALISIGLRSIPVWVGQVSSIIIATNAIVAATGYIFSTTKSYGFPIYIPSIGMAIHTSAGFILMAVAILLSRPSGMMELVTSGTRSGGIARRILVSVLVFPPLIGTLTKVGVIWEWYDIDTQITLFTVILVGIITRSTWKAARQAEREELRARESQESIENEQRFLAEVGSLLVSSLDYEQTLDNILNLAVRDIADIGIVYTFEKNGEIKRSKAVSRDPAKAWLCELLLKIPSDRSRKSPLTTVIDTKSSLLVEHISLETIESIAHSDEHLRALRAADIKSFILVPLLVRGKLLGVLNLVASSSSRSFVKNDLRLAEELAQRAAFATENAQLHIEAQRAKLIADNIPAMMAYWDQDQRCQFANHAYMDWFGVDPNKLVGSTLLDLMGTALYEKSLPNIQGALRGEKQSFERDLNMKTTGEIRHLKALYIPEKVKGKVLGFYVAAFDVTDLKKAQLSALAEKEKALAAVKTREDVLSIVSHDLKNPLAAVELSAQLLRKTNRVETFQVHDFANRIQRSVDQMQTLINDLLEFGKIQSGTFTVAKLRENPLQFIKDAEDGVRLLAESKNIHLEIDVAPDLPDVVCDARRINQVLSNLLGNAVKFTPNGGTVRLFATETESGIMISISDTGPGIPAEQLPKVFDRFWQARETQHLGSGLGLAITKGIIEAHGARIWAESQIGKGSCFSFTLPKAMPETVTKAIPSHAEHLPLKGIHVMLVDDSVDVLVLMKRVLENAGARVTATGSMNEALSKLTLENLDIVITDIEMPGGDGYDLIKKIHQISKKNQTRLPVVAFTAHTNQKELKQISDAGFDAQLPKPVHPKKMISLIRELLGS